MKEKKRKGPLNSIVLSTTRVITTLLPNLYIQTTPLLYVIIILTIIIIS